MPELIAAHTEHADVPGERRQGKEPGLKRRS